MKNQIEIDLHIKSKSWQNISQINGKICRIINKIIPKTPVKDFLKNKQNQIEISISLVSENQIRTINKDHRNKDKSTNILSFPALDLSKNKLDFNSLVKSHDYIFLGDIVISLENIRKEVLESGSKTFDSHLTHLILHSILHLIGHDHIDNQDAEKMEGLEVKILQSLKIKNPYDSY